MGYHVVVYVPLKVSDTVASIVTTIVGLEEGKLVGDSVGKNDGSIEGQSLGSEEGLDDGLSVGTVGIGTLLAVKSVKSPSRKP